MLYLKIALLLQILLSINFCSGQSVDVVQGSKGNGLVFLNKYAAVLQTSSAISLDSVLTHTAQQKFTPLENDNILFVGYNPDHYWYRFTLMNNDTVDQSFVLLLGGLGIREAEIWKGEGNGWSSLGKTGYQYSFAQRPYPYVQHAFPVVLSPLAKQTFYIRKIEDHAYKVVAFVLVEPGKMKQIEHRFYFLFGIISGLLFLFFILNLYLYFSVREKVHLFYALYVITILFFLIKNRGLDAQFFGLDSTFGYRTTYMGAVASLAVGFLLQVVQLFLNNLKNAGWLYRLLLFLKWSAFVSAVMQLLVFYYQPAHTIERLVFEWSNKSIIVSFIVIVAACCYSAYKGFSPALFLLIAQLPFMIGGVARALFIGAGTYVFPISLFEIGLVIEVVLISYGLVYRYNQYKKDKELLKEQLELQRVQTARQIMLVQESEQKRIAEDLHDELGGDLAAVKMTLQSFSLPHNQSETLVQLLDKASVNARNIAHNLMPPEFEQTDLDDLLFNYYSRLTKEGEILFHFYSSCNSNRFNKQDELMIYRVIMELTNNIIKHSGAAEATIQLIYHEEQLTITAEDDGNGFIQNNHEGIGLKNIRSRVTYLDGAITVDSGTHGSTIIIYIPYKQ